MKKYILIAMLMARTAIAGCGDNNGDVIEHPDNPPRLCAPEIVEWERVTGSDGTVKWRVFVKADRMAAFLALFRGPELGGEWQIFTNPVSVVANVQAGQVYGFVVPQSWVDGNDKGYLRAVTFPWPEDNN